MSGVLVIERLRRRHRAGSAAFAGRIEKTGRACVVVGQQSGTPSKKNSHTSRPMEKELRRSKLYFLDWDADAFTSASAASGLSIFALGPLLRWKQPPGRPGFHQPSGEGCEVLQEALSWRSPPPSPRRGRPGTSTNAPSGSPRPPSFTCFVNDPKAVVKPSRRYGGTPESAEGLGFDGSRDQVGSGVASRNGEVRRKELNASRPPPPPQRRFPFRFPVPMPAPGRSKTGANR